MNFEKGTSYFKDSPPIGLLISSVASKYEEEFLAQITSDRNFSDVTVSDHRVLRQITLTDLSSADIANHLGISKQALSKSISSLERRGYLTRTPSQIDKRVQTLTLTKKGSRLISKAIEVATKLEGRTKEILGSKHFQELQHLLKSLISTNLSEKES